MGYLKDETIHYLSWPSWEFFINPPLKTNHLTLDKLFPSLKRPKESKCLMIADPPNFLPSLVGLRSAQSKVDCLSILEGIPFDPDTEGNLKNQIKEGVSKQATAPDRGYLILGLYSLSMMEEKEINSLILDAEKRNRDMLSLLMGPDEDQEEQVETNERQSSNQIPDNLAEGIMKVWFRLASTVLLPGDRLWADSDQFGELLKQSHISVKNTTDEFYTNEHNL
jgi:hypothetical protein